MKVQENKHPKYDEMIDRWLELLPEEYHDSLKNHLSAFPYNIIIRPLVICDLENGCSERMLARKYKVTRRTIQWINATNTSQK